MDIEKVCKDKQYIHV